MHIRAFAVFCDIVDTGSFTKSAQKNHITQSAASQLMAAMEHHFHHRFLERTKQGIHVTREGRVLYEHGKQLMAQFAELDSKLEEVRQSIAGDIHLATVSSLGLHDLPFYLEKFRKTYPAVNVHIEYRCFDAVYQAVLNNEVDLGLVVSPRNTENMEIVPLHEDRMVFICHPEHPLARKKRINLNHLAGQTFVTYETEMPLRMAIDKLLREAGVTPGQVVELHNIEMVKRAVGVDVGIAVVPQRMVTREVADRTLTTLPLPDADLRCVWAAIHRSAKVISPALREFIEVLKGEP